MVLAQLFSAVMAAALPQQPTPQYYHSLRSAEDSKPRSGVGGVQRSRRAILRVACFARARAHRRRAVSFAGVKIQQVPQGEQAAALALLRHTSSVVFAEPAPQR